MLSAIGLLAVGLASASSPALAQSAGSFADGGDTKISAMMMFVGNDEKVYILDKAEGNAAQINGHAAWGAVWDMSSHDATTMDVATNAFCASGMHLPNGSFATFGGNGAIGPGGNIGSQVNSAGSGYFDDTYQDYDGTKAIRVLNPCSSDDNFDDANCQWYDDVTQLSMIKNRWYSAAEPLGDGTIAIIGGFVNGGYINRNWPNEDPEFEGGAADCTFEFYPRRSETAETMQFLIDTSGLNSYAHTYLMPSGKMLIQANVSTMLWDPDTNGETRLDDMPNGVVRVYPGSGGAAMLPLTPANDYTPTVLFCGGSDMPDYSWGNYSWPFVDTFYYPASKDCQRLTPEPTDGSTPKYEQDDDMIEGRTMGQFVILPDGKLLMVNGGENGTAGYSTQTLETQDYSDMPYGMSLASQPVGTPSLYDPNAAKGSRWSNEGFSTSDIARLYHSSALLLPDTSVLIAGSNPNVDVNTSTYFNTEYRAEIFYPPYFSAKVRPEPEGIPTTLTYGGDYFDIEVPSDGFSGSTNDAGDSAIVAVVRAGWTTHGMNMGQRFLQLNHTYTSNDNGSLTLHVAQMPPIPNIFQPGPAFVHVTINGVPSKGSYVIVGSGKVEKQTTKDASALPATVQTDATGGADDSSTATNGSTGSSDSSISTGAIVGIAVGALVVLGLIGALAGVCIARKRRAANRQPTDTSYMMNNNGGNTAPMMASAGGAAYGLGAGGAAAGQRGSESSAFVPLRQDYAAHDSWGSSTASLHGPYKDQQIPQHAPQFQGQGDYIDGRQSSNGMSMDYDPYAADSRMRTGTPGGHHY